MEHYRGRIEKTVQVGVVKMFTFVESAADSSKSLIDQDVQACRMKGVTKRGMVQQKSNRK